MASRQEVIDFIVKRVDAIIPGFTFNGDLIRKNLTELSEKEFAAFMEGLKPKTQLKEGEVRSVIPFYLPNLVEKKVSIARMFKLTRGLGRSLSHRLVMTDPKTGLRYATLHEYPCMDTIVRRQAQTGFKKRSIPGVRQQIDDLTGQPTALSKGSRISSPESRFLDSRGLVHTQTELVHVRGGAKTAYREFRKRLMQNGQVSLEELQGLGPAKSTETLSALLNSQLLGNNVLPGTRVPEDALPLKRK